MGRERGISNPKQHRLGLTGTTDIGGNGLGAGRENRVHEDQLQARVRRIKANDSEIG